ncbi:hypothetical protein EVAR_29390_1 [Eumeta japonica]|uniref:Uncharacterized protein n=1 Tax=Eumeta variegata TaxID=151549 RepID=A0A4C1ZU12_EUMVA|nr:hypothetical protein EVAR_29390_1 [Eumeta japonica]
MRLRFHEEETERRKNKKCPKQWNAWVNVGHRGTIPPSMRNSASCCTRGVTKNGYCGLHQSKTLIRKGIRCGWESLMKSVTLGNVTMSHRTREPAECLASLSHSTMIGLPRAH